jgi:hypothetical protein
MFYRVQVRWHGDGRAAQEVMVTIDADSGDAAAAAAHARVQAERGGSTVVAGVMPVSGADATPAAPIRRPTRPRPAAAAKRKPRQQEKTR